MAKPLAGKRWFYAKGQSDAARKMRMNPACRSQRPGCWPDYAKAAYIRGWHEI